MSGTNIMNRHLCLKKTVAVKTGTLVKNRSAQLCSQNAGKNRNQ
jgi:hypothetical protein